MKTQRTKCSQTCLGLVVVVVVVVVVFFLRHDMNEKDIMDELDCEMSSCHFVRMYMFRKVVNSICKWSHGYEESERSVMTSLMRPFCCL